MPQSITIAAFGLGAVGGFRIFGVEVDGSPGRFGRVFAGLLGVILIGLGLVTSVDKSLFQSAADGGKTAIAILHGGISELISDWIAVLHLGERVVTFILLLDDN